MDTISNNGGTKPKSLPNDVISKIASLADRSTRKTLNVTSKITRTRIKLSESEKMQIAKSASKKCVLEEAYLDDDVAPAENIININITTDGTNYRRHQYVGFRKFIWNLENITVEDCYEYNDSLYPFNEEEVNTYIENLIETNDKSTQRLILHAAAALYVKDHWDMIKQEHQDAEMEEPVGFPDKNEWFTFAKQMLNKIPNLPTDQTKRITMPRVRASHVQQAPTAHEDTSRVRRNITQGLEGIAGHKEIAAVIETGTTKEFVKNLQKQTQRKLAEQEGGKPVRKSLDKCTVEELKARAAKRCIKVAGLKKAEIIAKLRK
jgi:hypothetical protein